MSSLETGEALANIRKKLDLGKGMGYNTQFVRRCAKALLAAFPHVCLWTAQHSFRAALHPMASVSALRPKTRIAKSYHLGWNQSPQLTS